MKNIGRIIYYTISVILGCAIPIFFAYLDMWELEIETNGSNLLDILKSQNIYIFSALFFPGIFCLMSELIVQVWKKSQMLQEDFEYLKVLLNATPDAIIFLDANKKVQFQNDQFKLLFGDYSKVLESAKVNGYFERIDYLQKEVTLHSTVTDSHPFIMSFKLARYNNQKNYFLSFKDLKNLKDKEQIIEDQKNQMVEKNKLAALGQMAAGIAHEINNPLTVIQSNSAIINKLIHRETIDTEKCSRLIDKTRNQIIRITNIISSLRSLSKGLASDEKQNFAIDQLLEEAINLAKIRACTKRIHFNFEPKTLSAYGNRGQIVQVILNLLNNAMDAIENKDKPWINIELSERGHYIDVYITDCGAGISADIVSKIFLPMYTTKEVGKGTGLGLSLSRSFIEQNSGTLDYIADRQNTCFKVSLIKSSSATKETAA